MGFVDLQKENKELKFQSKNYFFDSLLMVVEDFSKIICLLCFFNRR